MRLSLTVNLFLAGGIAIGAFQGCAATSLAERKEAEAARQADREDKRQRDARHTHDLGIVALESGNFDTALRLLSSVVQDEPQFALARNNLGIAYWKSGNFYEAALQFDAAAKLLPQQAEPLVNLGMLLEEAGRHQSAADQFRIALNRDPQNADATAALARVKVRLSERDSELNQLLNKLDEDPRSPWQGWAATQKRPSSSDPIDRAPDTRRIELEGVSPPSNEGN